jgi:ribulose-5-phosphate 4-epimerase/fuculose-1-phosphate aldolase
MFSVDPTKVEAFVAGARKAAGYGLMRCSSGNMSCRLDQSHMLVKASRCWMAELDPEDVCVCRITDGSLVTGRPPSVEIGFHSGLLHARPDVNVVLHFQTPYATALACHEPPIENYFIIPEVPYYIGPIAHVPHIRPGSRELAQAVVKAMADHDLAQLANHGQVVVGQTYDDVIQKAVFFELACELLYHTGKNARLLTAEQVVALKASDARV